MKSILNMPVLGTLLRPVSEILVLRNRWLERTYARRSSFFRHCPESFESIRFCGSPGFRVSAAPRPERRSPRHGRRKNPDRRVLCPEIPGNLKTARWFPGTPARPSAVIPGGAGQFCGIRKSIGALARRAPRPSFRAERASFAAFEKISALWPGAVP